MLLLLLLPLVFAELLKPELARDVDEAGEPLGEDDMEAARRLRKSNRRLWSKPFDELPVLGTLDLFEGDLVLSKAENASSAVADVNKRWEKFKSDALVPYSISASYGRQERAVIALAMLEITEKTCVTFVPKGKADLDFIHITEVDSEERCKSQVGRQGGTQLLSLAAEECLRKGFYNPGTALHHLVHTLGFWHEHSRPDRDKFITVIEDNIVPAYVDLLAIVRKELIDDLGAQYDICSIMHFHETAFAKEGTKSLVPKETPDCGHPIGHGPGRGTQLSDGDVKRINTLYKCSGKPMVEQVYKDGVWNEWAEWSECSEGTQYRWRSCYPPTGGGKPCQAENGLLMEDSRLCSDKVPLVDGTWNPWGVWGACSGGVQYRWRSCVPPTGGGKPCLADSNGVTLEDQRSCGVWNPWGAWGKCSAAGLQYRWRSCDPPLEGGLPCQPNSDGITNEDQRACDPDAVVKPPDAEVFFASLGSAAEWVGHALGQFDLQEETFDGRPTYKQKDTEGKTDMFIYFSNGKWLVNDDLGVANTGWLRIKSDSFSLPVDGWEFWVGDSWSQEDPSLALKPGSFVPCTSVFVDIEGEALLTHWSVLGTYTLTGQWSEGRPVYQQEFGRGFYLSIGEGGVVWAIRTLPGDSRTVGVQSGRGTNSPGVPEAGPSVRRGVGGWRFAVAPATWKEGEIEVACEES